MPDARTEWIGLIAGNGRFPLLFAENARRLGYRVSAVALTGEADPSLEKVVDRIHWIALGQLQRLIKAFKEDGVRQAVMVRSVQKTHLFSDIRPDLRSLALLRRVSVRKDDTLLRAIASELEDEGDRKSTRLNSSHGYISYAVFCLKKKITSLSPLPRMLCGLMSRWMM